MKRFIVIRKIVRNQKKLRIKIRKLLSPTRAPAIRKNLGRHGSCGLLEASTERSVAIQATPNYQMTILSSIKLSLFLPNFFLKNSPLSILDDPPPNLDPLSFLPHLQCYHATTIDPYHLKPHLPLLKPSICFVFSCFKYCHPFFCQNPSPLVKSHCHYHLSMSPSPSRYSLWPRKLPPRWLGDPPQSSSLLYFLYAWPKIAYKGYSHPLHAITLLTIILLSFSSSFPFR